jgi:hypothetical protein
MTPMGVRVAANDNWQSDLTSAAQLIAHGLAPSDSSEAGLVVTLPHGAFTAISERQIRRHRDRTSRSVQVEIRLPLSPRLFATPSRFCEHCLLFADEISDSFT